ncbi:MAG: LuxR C-terminal-related transcriptional regulator, partial [Dehalococcoidia bacterium]
MLESKFHSPSLHPEHVSRPRLLRQLDTGAPRRVTLVDAPPGSGKSMLLAEWCHMSDQAGRCAWLSLDGLDNDPIVFWTYLVEALRRIAPDCFGRTVATLNMPGMSLTRAVIPTLINELWAMDYSLTLVLDDYHTITNFECHESLSFFLRRLPAKLRLVIATRSDPPLGLSHLRVGGELCELRAADLCFAGDEVEAFLNDSLGLGLEADDLERLAVRTEGWAAGLYLAALSLRNRADRSAFIADFAGDNRHIVTYLGGEVLNGLPDEERAFLMQTSILERFSPALCDAVVSTSESAKRLQDLEQTNLFVISLDERAESYRYHHLLQDLLQLELKQTQPELLPVLHKRASAWYRSAGNVDAAMHHAQAAGDYLLAGDIYFEAALSMLWSGRLVTLANWLDMLPDELIAMRPPLALTAAWVAGLSGRSPAEVEQCLAAAADGPDEGPFLLREPSLATAIALLRATFPVDDAAVAVAASEDAVAAVRDPYTTAYVLSRAALGRARYLAGHPREARGPLEEALRAPLAPRQVVGASRAMGTLALVYLELGEEAHARDLARRAVQMCEENDLSSHPSTWINYLALGTILAREGRLEQAEAVMALKLEPLLEALRHWPLFHAMALLGLASVRLARGHQRAAASLLAEARTVIEGCADPGILREQLTAIERRLQHAPRLRTGLEEELTEGELRVLRLLASDLSQREIGRELYLSVNTVKSHTKTIYSKLGTNSREATILRARSLALI